MRTSVVIPAHNEEQLLPAALAAIAVAADAVSDDVEVVVVANRCTDATAEIAEGSGALVVESDARNISAVRNAGVAASTGEVVVTVDADCTVSPAAFGEVSRMLGTARYVGGGAQVRPERASLGIAATYALMEITTALARLSGGMFWCLRSDFDAIGGFDEAALLGEDVDFARRLRAHGKRTGRRFTILRTAPIIASCRKFDRYGDWHMFGMALQAREIRAVMTGSDTAWVDRYFFDFNG